MHKDVQFICVDWGPDVKAQASTAMLEFLARALQVHAPSIILMHHQPVPIGSRWLDAFIADEVGRFWEVVRGQNVLGIFFGYLRWVTDTSVGDSGQTNPSQYAPTKCAPGDQGE